jgi:hypothetical protein
MLPFDYRWRATRPMTTIALVGGCVLLLNGCANKYSTHETLHKLGQSDVLLSSAELRATVATPVTRASDGSRLLPDQVVCAEPSPDVAKAVQESFGLGGGLGVDIPTQVSGSAAVSIARARAEAAAQLGERLATIQLLRDGLYRACEAYANGAFSETTYALLLSRYDDTMVTLLSAELAAGNFGRQLAALGGSADASSNASADLDSALGAAALAKQQLDEAEQAKGEAEQELADAEADLAAAEAAGETETSEEAAAVEEKEDEVEDAERRVKLAIESAAKAAATATAAVGGITQTASKDVAQVVHEIQRKYIENISTDALMVACVVAMSKPEESGTAMRNFCAGSNGQDGFMQYMVHEGSQALQHSKLLPIQYRDRASLTQAIATIKEMREEIETLTDDRSTTLVAGGR